ncbi:MAG: class I SAM-dependent DNA methyltransferase, partial [Candidatus Pacebacteria bacterium]|nr:class I SAM-dependent DNA methyltransferase [Candidatus Paceibacterota bacterium]
MKEFLIETLTKKFDSESYQKFVLEFFNDLVPNIRELDIHPGYVSHIDNLKLIGEYADPAGKKMHILEVRLKTHSKLENARTVQRNIVIKHIKDYWLDGALVAFYTPGSSSWRLSFIKIEYKFDNNGRTKEELTPPKRYSFLVGVNEPSHTAQQQLLPLVKETNYNPTLKQIEDAFSVEKVTKEFFAKYKELFEITVKELNKNHTFKNEASKNNIVTENFTKKLLGQIVFLYFLQKKGWLGVQTGQFWGDGDRNFLRQLFEDSKTKGKNFFNNYLEILFYDTLNNPRRNTADPSFSKYFNCRIPFLNGGLFEPEYDWQNSFIYLDDDIFEKILNVFDLYNFTVKEDEPLEKEVAVDPEMLGKVFENLLEENLRKGKGTYYTPREIVHYMCQESLINHLVTETKT